VKTVGFFSSRGGIGKTTLIYHLASMYQELGIGTVALDLDPQADLTMAFLPEDRLMALMRPEIQAAYGIGVEIDLDKPVLQEIGDHLALLPSSPKLGIAAEWVFGDDPAAKVVSRKLLTLFSHLTRETARIRKAEIVLIDVAPGLSNINRSAFLACDAVIVPLSSSPLSFWGLPALGISLMRWRSEWEKRADQESLSGGMENIGYVILQHASNPDQSLPRNILDFYHRTVLGAPEDVPTPSPDPYHLATLKRYPSLMSLAQDARKPMFLLKPADGAIGSHVEAVRDCYRDFKQLALRIAAACGLSIPS
jgi:chromosome partitioning protein